MALLKRLFSPVLALNRRHAGQQAHAGFISIWRRRPDAARPRAQEGNGLSGGRPAPGQSGRVVHSIVERRAPFVPIGRKFSHSHGRHLCTGARAQTSSRTKRSPLVMPNPLRRPHRRACREFGRHLFAGGALCVCAFTAIVETSRGLRWRDGAKWSNSAFRERKNAL